MPAAPTKANMQGAALKRLLRLLPSEAVLAADALAAADAALADDWSSTDAGALALALTVNLMAQELLNKPAYGRDVTHTHRFAPVGPSELLDLLRFARYSDAVYHPDAAALAQHCSASQEEVVLPPRRPTDDSLAPHYAVLVDHSRREIVLAIRGTASVTDLITDACGYPAHVILGGDSKEGAAAEERKAPLLRRAAAAVRTGFQRLRQGAMMGEHEHHAHSGVARGAVSILIDAAPIIDELTQRLPKYSVSITGHSLGAGAAALCATLVNAPCHAGTISILMPSSETERTEPLSESEAAQGSSSESSEPDSTAMELPAWVPSHISSGVRGLLSAAKRNAEQTIKTSNGEDTGVPGQQGHSKRQREGVQGGSDAHEGGGHDDALNSVTLSNITSEDDVAYTAWKNDALIEAVRTWRVALCRAHGSGATSHDSGRAALDGQHALRAVVFAAPACVTPGLSKLARSTTTCLIHGDDMVPRLRLGALMQLRADMASLEWKDDIVQLIPAIKQRLGAAGKLLDLSVSALSSPQRGGAKVASTADWLDRELTQWQAHVQARESKRQEDDKADAHGLMLRTASGFVPPGRLLQMSYGSSEARACSGPFELLGAAAKEGGEGGGDAAEEDSAADTAEAIKKHLQDFVGETAEDDVPKTPFSVDRLISTAVAGVKELEGLVGAEGGEGGGQHTADSAPQPPRPLHVTEVPADTQVGDVLRTLVVSRHMLSDHLILGTCHALEHALLQAQRKKAGKTAGK